MHGRQKPELDAALEKGRQTTDPAARHELYKELARVIADEYPSVFLYQAIDLVAFRESLHVPGFADPKQSIPIMAGNYRYDRMTMDV